MGERQAHRRESAGVNVNGKLNGCLQRAWLCRAGRAGSVALALDPNNVTQRALHQDQFSPLVPL